MAEYRTSAHALSDIKYHIVWITKYRYKVLRGDVAERARDLIRQICESREIKIIRGAVSPDHIHILVAAPPHLAPSKIVQYIKAALRGVFKKSIRRCENGIGDNICGPEDIFARRWERSTRKR